MTFTATIQVPPGTGEVVDAEWSFSGSGDDYESSQIPAGQETVTLETDLSYSEPGTYFPVLRATSQRDPGDRYAAIQNISRVRVVVE